MHCKIRFIQNNSVHVTTATGRLYLLAMQKMSFCRATEEHWIGSNTVKPLSLMISEDIIKGEYY